ncbi:MAG: OPT family oligopeptide transporter [Pseudomonadota bacterium]|nr:OPT family oligopeptide transporter [Pseudomonadota bacterium]
MSQLQPAPQTQAEVDAARPLSIPPDQVLDMDEATWYAKIYRGEHMPQLTLRAVGMGSFLGFFLAFTNLYIGLKTGWGLGVAITACILSFAIWNVLLKVGLAKTPMTILETNCMQSTASAAGYATGGTMVSAIAALLMLSATEANPQGAHLPVPVLVAWTFFLAVLGTVLAIPMKRNLINHERLKFPSGTAAAVTLQSLYSEGEQAIKKARVLMWSAIFGAIFPLLLELPLRTTPEGKVGLLPADLKIFDWLPARGSHVVDGKVEQFKPSDWTMVFDNNPVMIAAGAIVGMRVSIYMLLGSLALIFAVGPIAYEAEWMSPVTNTTIRAASAPYKAWKEIGLWLGVPIMVSSGLLGFAFQWRTILRAFQGFGRKSGGQDSETEALVARTEVPFSWFAVGGLFSGAGVIITAHAYFDVPWFYGVLAVGMTFFLALVACRATGESDITPVGAMGKIMQLTYGALIPQSTTANLMTASITASAAGSAADLLNDLKSGYLLGANPRRQFLAQFAGIFSGTAATVMGFYLLVPNAEALNGSGGTAPKFPAPAAQAWKAVAEVFKNGLENMHPMHQQAIVVGLVIGAVLLVVETFSPKNVKPYLPSATGIGLGLILPFQYPFAMLIGAGIAWFWNRKNAAQAEDYLVPISAGVIAGVSIMGVLVAVLNNLVLA